MEQRGGKEQAQLLRGQTQPLNPLRVRGKITGLLGCIYRASHPTGDPNTAMMLWGHGAGQAPHGPAPGPPIAGVSPPQEGSKASLPPEPRGPGVGTPVALCPLLSAWGGQSPGTALLQE